MKKSLVALAAMAVVGAASAQVTITGLMSMSQQSSLTGATGLALSDSAIFLGDTEDLGGGVKAVMSLGFDAGGHAQAAANGPSTGAGVAGMRSENTSLSLVGGFGAVKLMSFESDGPFAQIEALSGASLDVGMFDSSAVGPGKRFRNGVSYTAPSMSGFTPSLTYVTLAGQYNQAAVLGEKTKTVPAVSFVSGPLTVYAEYDILNASYNTSATTGSNPDDAITQPFINVKYDFGGVVVGAGWTKPSNDGASYILGASIPVGAVTFGLVTTSYNAQTNNTTPANPAGGVAGLNSTLVANNGVATWTEASVAYSLSKRTSLKASFAQTNDAGVAYANVGSATNYGLTTGLVQNCQYRVGLYHSF